MTGTEQPPSLTERARENLDSGATSGPGTRVCGNCGLSKEPRRLNSRICSLCANGGGVIRLLIEPGLYRRIASAAAERDETIEGYCARLLAQSL